MQVVVSLSIHLQNYQNQKKKTSKYDQEMPQSENIQTWPRGAVCNVSADPGVASLIPARSHTFTQIVHKKFLLPFSSLPLIQEGLLFVASESMYTTYWLTA